MFEKPENRLNIGKMVNFRMIFACFEAKKKGKDQKIIANCRSARNPRRKCVGTARELLFIFLFQKI